MNARQLANQLTVWVDATRSRIAQLRYLAHIDMASADQARLLSEAMALELLCEELQAYVSTYSTVRQLRGAVQHTLHALQRDLGAMPETDHLDQQNAVDEPTARREGRAQAYRSARSALSEIVGAG
jgi:hypothetical protein